MTAGAKSLGLRIGIVMGKDRRNIAGYSSMSSPCAMLNEAQKNLDSRSQVRNHSLAAILCSS